MQIRVHSNTASIFGIYKNNRVFNSKSLVVSSKKDAKDFAEKTYQMTVPITSTAHIVARHSVSGS